MKPFRAFTVTFLMMLAASQSYGIQTFNSGELNGRFTKSIGGLKYISDNPADLWYVFPEAVLGTIQYGGQTYIVADAGIYQVRHRLVFSDQAEPIGSACLNSGMSSMACDPIVDYRVSNSTPWKIGLRHASGKTQVFDLNKENFIPN